MAYATPYKTSNDIIDAVKRRISFPFSQNTFIEEDILKFSNEEMDIGQVPSVLEYHENFFVFTEDKPIKAGRNRYPIPERAIGQRIKDLHYVDENQNEIKIVEIQGENRSFYEGNTGNNYPHRYYFEGNDIVIHAREPLSTTGTLRFKYFLRPNRLVLNERAAICTNFTKTVQIVNASLVSGDIFIIGDEQYVAGTDFAIGGTSVITATNLVAAINAIGTYPATNGTVSTDTILIRYQELDTEISAENTTGFIIQSTQGIEFDQIPDNITNGSYVDFLQTNGGHKTYKIDIKVPLNGISSLIINFKASDVHDDFKVGDYICTIHESIIPQIPDDLHIALVERICAAILASISDLNGLKAKQEKIKEIEIRHGTLIDNRSEGDSKKIMNFSSPLRVAKRRNIRRKF